MEKKGQFERRMGTGRERAARGQIRCSAIFSFAVLALLSAPGCSSSSATKNKNTISPYDREFEPDKDEHYTPENIDTSELELLERAKDSYDRGLFSVARENWLKLREGYPASPYATLAELKIADCFFYAGDYGAAITAYEEFIKLHPGHESAPYARYQIGKSFQEQYTGPEHDQAPLFSAMKNYQSLLEFAPEHEFAVLARTGMNECREMLAEHELFVAGYYARQGKDAARAGRLRLTLHEYPETNAAVEAKRLLLLSGETLATPEGAPALRTSKSVPSVPQLVFRDRKAEPARGSLGTTPARESLGRSLPLRTENAEREIAADHAAAIRRPITEEAIGDPSTALGESRVVQAVTCDHVGEFSIFTVFLASPLRISTVSTPLLRSRATASGFALLTSGGESLTADQITELQEHELPSQTDRNATSEQLCTLGDYTLSATELQNPKPSHANLIRARVNGLRPSESLRFFTLDRPDRLIALIGDRAGDPVRTETESSALPRTPQLRELFISSENETGYAPDIIAAHDLPARSQRSTIRKR